MAVFYSFHYQQDAWRVQQIINMGVIEGQSLLNAAHWSTSGFTDSPTVTETRTPQARIPFPA